MDDDSQTVVSASWLHTHHADVRILDASWHMPAANRDARDEYMAVHIPGAMFFDIDAISDRASTLPHMLPNPETFADEVGALGISNDDQVVVYDSTGLFSAARAWWMLRAMGHTRVAVLNGGLPAWTQLGGDVTTHRENPSPKTFKADLSGGAVTSLDQMRGISRTASRTILDARPAGRFTGSQPEPRPGLPSGHMPNALSLPFTDVLTADGYLKPVAALKDTFAELGVTERTEVVTTCGSGVTAAILSLALKRIGVQETSLYDGSWTEWGSREDCPIETG